MTNSDVEAEVGREPFVALRFHLVSGKTLAVREPNTAFALRNGLLVLQRGRYGRRGFDGYDVIAYRNIERIEQLPPTRGRGRRTGAA